MKLKLVGFLLVLMTILTPRVSAEEVSVPDTNLAAHIKAYIGDSITTETMKNLTVLTAENSSIEDLTGLEHAVNLTSLSLDGNSISDISALSGLTNLQLLYLDENSISDISALSGLTNLRQLALSGNSISDISALSGLTNLQRLELDGNSISDISALSGLTNLTSLDLDDNSTSDISDLSGLTNLTTLNLEGNSISDISDLSGLTDLTTLYLGDNSTSDISDLSGLTNLTSLDLRGNSISDISDLSGLTNLTHLILPDNSISDISALSGLTNLTHLLLIDNSISDISALSGLTNLRQLLLGDNSISDISALSGLTNLQLLQLDDNSISDISPLLESTSPTASTELEYVYIYRNPLSSVSINTHIPALEQRGIRVFFDEPSEADALPAVSSEERSRIAGALAMDRVIFNELRNATTDAHDWVELRNVSDTDVTLDGWEVRIVTGETTGSVTLPPGTVLPVGGLLLLVNTDPDAPEMPLSTPEGNVVSVVDTGLILPQTHFTLLLRSDAAWEDSVGNFFFGYEIPPTAPPLTTDATWYRARPDVLGYQAEAWVMSGYQDGIGYDVGVPAASALGTPGHPQSSLMGDVNSDGTVNILDLVFVASRFDAPNATEADLNGDGAVNIQDLVMVANGLGSVAAAPAAQTLHASHVQQWLALAKQEVAARSIQTLVSEQQFSYERGIQVLEQLLVTLVPKSTALLANYPNPFNPETWIPYRLAKGSDVQLRIYDTQGRMVRHLDIGHQAAGVYETRSRAAYWDGTNEMGESVASGLYFYTLTAGDFSATRRMLILK